MSFDMLVCNDCNHTYMARVMLDKLWSLHYVIKYSVQGLNAELKI